LQRISCQKELPRVFKKSRKRPSTGIQHEQRNISRRKLEWSKKELSMDSLTKRASTGTLDKQKLNIQKIDWQKELYRRYTYSHMN